MSRFTGKYTPTTPMSVLPNEECNMVTVRGKKLRVEITTRIIRTIKKGYVLSNDPQIMTG